MSLQKKNSRCMEKPGLGYGHCATQMDVKPFSIRHYVFKSRQRNILQNWPFAQKYLKLCLDNGINNVLPPIGTPISPSNGLHGRLEIDLSLGETEKDDSVKIHRTKLDKTEKRPKPGKDFSTKNAVRLLCRKLGQLSLSFDGDTLVGHEQRFKIGTQTYGNAQRFKAHSSFHKNMCQKGRRRKGKTKMKSLEEILAVAKHCILDGNDRVMVSGHGMQDVGKQSERKVKGKSSGLNSRSTEPKEGFSIMKKHLKCDDSVAGIGQLNKRSCTMGVINYKNDGCTLKSWSRKMSSCKTAETEKKTGGYKRKALKTYDSVVELQDHHAY